MRVLSKISELARRRPTDVAAVLLAIHLVVWTLVPFLASANLQLDLAEGLVMGREWQLGYWKHPPLPWWITDLVYRLTGAVNSVYLLGALASTICMLAVWVLARDIVGPTPALVATFALEGIHFYNWSVVKFAHDQMQLPVWALTALFLYRAMIGGRAHYWLLAGVSLAAAFWTKYSAISFAVSIGLFLLLDPDARRSWRTPGPYLMATAFVLAIAPHIGWLAANDYLPFDYASMRAKRAASWDEYFTFPARWIGGQFFFLLPAIGLLALCYRGQRPSTATGFSFAGRYATTLALGPFVFVTATSLALGRLPVLMWGYPLWSFLPLATVVWFGTVSVLGQRRFTAGLLAVLVATPVLFVTVPVIESMFRNRTRGTDFPGRLLAEKLTEIWHAKINAPFLYVSGDDFAANNVAVFSKDRPRVIVDGVPYRSPWIDMADVGRAGVIITWADGLPPEWLLELWKKNFPGFDPAVSHVIELPRGGWRSQPPIRMRYAILPPRRPP